jgi:hypothetical protein
MDVQHMMSYSMKQMQYHVQYNMNPEHPVMKQLKQYMSQTFFKCFLLAFLISLNEDFTTKDIKW